MTTLLLTAPWLMTAAALLWLHSLRSKNFGHVDILWPLHHIIACFGVCVALPKLEWRGILLLLLVTVWGIRLATYLATRLAIRLATCLAWQPVWQPAWQAVWQPVWQAV